MSLTLLPYNSESQSPPAASNYQPVGWVPCEGVLIIRYSTFPRVPIRYRCDTSLYLLSFNAPNIQWIQPVGRPDLTLKLP